ncbi:MAG: N-acetylmuramoyl-L-alanine amidase [Elusimicrobia bacterium]|nr:N-acetylmuramoyl-L-alanine amidase [Elusimicrobiota bacterium]
MSLRRIFLPALVLFVLTMTASSQDLGFEAVFPNPRFGAFGDSLLYDSGPSAPVSEPWDTVLFQGRGAGAQARFEVSRSGPGEAENWVEADVTRYPNGRFWGRTRLEPRPGGVRIRVLGGGSVRDALEIYSVELFLSEPIAASTPGADGEKAESPDRPYVFGRDFWRAKPPKEPYTPHRPWRITIHHTAGLRPRTLPESIDELRFTQDFHQNGRGWSDIAYHFLIDPMGRIFRGRPEDVEGAHTAENNPGNIGIALLGHYHPPKNHEVSPEALAALSALALHLGRRYRVDSSKLMGHRDYRPTSCPGDGAYGLIEILRKEWPASPPLSLMPLPSLKLAADWYSR